MQVTVKKMVETLDQYRPICKIIVLTGYFTVGHAKTRHFFTEYWMSTID